MILIKPAIHTGAQSELITPFIYNTFPTSLGFLAGYLRHDRGVVPRIIDEGIAPLDRRLLENELARDAGPRIVGMTVITINSYRAFRLAEMIKEIDGRYTVILGGIHPTVLPDECLANPAVDIVVRGEGEETLSELTGALLDGRDYRSVAGISYRDGTAVRHNPSRELIDLGRIPPFPYDLFEPTYDRYRDFGTVISGRGCPFDCIFCSQRAITGRRYRYVNNEQVLNDIETLITKYGQKKIWFMDDNFLVNKDRAMSLIDGIIRRGFHEKAGFCAEMRGESVTYEILRKMKEANFKIMSLGMETMSQRLLDFIDKKEKVEDNIRAVKMAHEVGIGTSTTFIFGLPTETREERLTTARLARSIPLDDARFNVAVPYPGTRLFDIANKEGRLLVKPGWYNFNVQFYMFGDDIPYVPEMTDRYQLMFDTFVANLRFNVRLKTLISFFTSPIAGGMVLTLPDRWYLSPKSVWQIMRLAFFIVRRFFILSVRSSWRGLIGMARDVRRGGARA